MEQFIDLFRSFDPETPSFPPTELCSEGWLLRIILDWFSRHQIEGFPLAFPPEGDWFLEALLPSPFLPRYRGDPLSETRTHAIGGWRLGQNRELVFVVLGAGVLLLSVGLVVLTHGGYELF